MDDAAPNNIVVDGSVSNLPNDGVGQSSSLIEPFPEYRIQYYPYQQRRELHSDERSRDDAPRIENTMQQQNETIEDADAYQPLPINPTKARRHPQISSQQEEAFPFEDSQDQSEEPTLMYFHGDSQIAPRSLRPSSQAEEFDNPSQENFPYLQDEQHGGQIYRQQQEFDVIQRKHQQTVLEPVPLEMHMPQPQPQQQQLFEQTIEPQPWPPKQSLPPGPQLEPTTWWDSSNLDETINFQGNEFSHVVVAGLQIQPQQGVETVQRMEQPTTQQPGIPILMHQGKRLRPQQPIFGQAHEQTNQPLQMRVVTGQDAVLQFLGTSSRPLQTFQHPPFFPPTQPHFPADSMTVETSIVPRIDKTILEISPPQLKPQQRNGRTGKLSTKTVPKVTMDMLRTSRKPKDPEAYVDNYVLRVHDMLEDAQTENFSDVISWQNHGRAFKIHQPEKFYREILPKYFHCKQASFVRWLRAWGFVRLVEGPDRGAYFHRYFVRGVTSLIKNKTRNQMNEAMENWSKLGDISALSLGKVTTSNDEGKANGSNAENGDLNRYQNDKLNDGASLPVPSKDPKILRGKLLHEIREMLRMADVEGFSNIVRWCKSGKSFRIYKRGPFQQKIMGKYLTCSKLTYLSDMLRLWGFCRLKNASGDERNAYYHRLFQRGKPELCRNLSKEQMFDSMKDFREEQKRLQETSWSLVVADVDLVDELERARQDQIASGANQSNELIDQSGRLHHGKSQTTDQQSQNVAISNRMLNSVNDDKNTIGSIPGGDGTSIPLSGPQSPVQTNVRAAVEMNQYGPAYFFDPTLHSLGHGKSFASIATTMPRLAAIGDPKLNNTALGTKTTYVVGIHTMLEDAELKGFSDIVSWIPHGRCFRIHNEKRFGEDILPKYFSAKIPSFYRWLRAWGFTRLSAGKDRGCWYHRFFVRGVTDLVKDLSRQEMFEAMEKWAEPGKEPDFSLCGKGRALSEKLVTKKALIEGSGDKNRSKSEDIGDTNEDVGTGNDECEGCIKQSDPRRLRGRVLEDIRDMLDQAKAEGAEHVVSWLIHGKAFAVHNRSEFMERFLPRFLSSKKFVYFTDVLRSWGFVRLKQSRDRGAYYHKLFMRDDPRSTLHLSRKQMKEAMIDWKTACGNEPDLYKGISEDILRASEQIQALGGLKKKRKKKRLNQQFPKKIRKTFVAGLEDKVTEV